LQLDMLKLEIQNPLNSTPSVQIPCIKIIRIITNTVTEQPRLITRTVLTVDERKVLPVQGYQRAEPRKIVARKWDQSALGTSHPYELVGA
jgi:hypothetical protein